MFYLANSVQINSKYSVCVYVYIVPFVDTAVSLTADENPRLLGRENTYANVS